MSYQEVARKVLTEAIRTASYIDDEVVMPFTNSEENRQYQISKDIFNSFNDQNIHISQIKFDTTVVDIMDKIKAKLKRSDILVLDWQLEPNTPHEYCKSLDIIKSACSIDNLHFIALYTRENNVAAIKYAICSYFDGIQISDDEKKRLITYIDDSDLETSLKTDGKSLALASEADRQMQGRTMTSVQYREHIRELKSISPSFQEVSSIEMLIKIGYILNDQLIGVGNNKHAYKIGSNYVQIDDLFIVIMQKDTVTPDTIMDTLTSTLVDIKPNFITFLNLEFRNKINNGKIFLNEKFYDIADSTFAYHQKTTKPEEDFIEYLKDFYVLKIHQELDFESSEINTRLQELATTPLETPADEELQMLNAFYNLDSRKKRVQHIEFGDVFDAGNNSYLLCITAHCDCLQSDNIKNNFFFVKGTKTNLKKATEEGDEGFNSFIDDKLIIEWTNKPFTIYVPKNKNNVEAPIDISLNGANAGMKHIGKIKENYAQRIANNAFGHAMRVGISFAKKPKSTEGSKRGVTTPSAPATEAKVAE